MSIPAPKKYISDFENLGFGMFVHWGLYSQLGEGEWTYFIRKRDMKDYEKLKDTFTAEDFDAEKLVLMAKNAGCKYITLTTRHHEGFSLYDTCGLNDFDAPNSPAKRDLIREFVDACRKYDIVPFFYHTTLDWHNEDFEKDFDSYLEYLRKSVEILCKNYGKIGGLWFDGNWSKPNADWKEDELYATIRKYQPEAMIVNNTGMGERGKVGNPEIDSVTFEQDRPEPLNREGMPKYIAAEMCETVNDHWGIGKFDLNYKSPRQLIENLCFCRKAGANYLLNIGPTAQGGIDVFQEALFGLLGKWIGVFGEAIYEGRPYTAKCNGRNFILKAKDGKSLYIFSFDLGINGNDNVSVEGEYEGVIAFKNVTDTVKKVYWLDNNEKLSFMQDKTNLTVNLTGYNYGESYCVRVAKAEI
ncbi:MAG: alpha-L-fucosidase [Clostridia bacterium]|nr:alpha-L-fucosidase [Clostridia bacterium]